MTNAPQQPKKTSTAMMVVMVAGGCLLLGIMMSIGKSLGYAGVLLGLLGAGGSVALFLKQPGLKKLGGWGAVLSVLLIVTSFKGASDNKQAAEQQAAAMAAAEKKVADDKAKLDKAVGALGPNLSGDQLAAACVEAEKAGGIPADQAGRCGDALLAAGQAALAAKHPTDALPSLELAMKLTTKKDDVVAALKEAKIATATETAAAELKRAEAAWAAKDYGQAFTAAQAAQQAAADGMKEKPDDAVLKGLANKIDPVFRRADERNKVEALVGAEKFEFGGGALVVTHQTDTSKYAAKENFELNEVFVDGHYALKNLAASGFEQVPSLQSITVVEFATYHDVRGNERRSKVAEFMVTRKTAKSINWQSITGLNVLKVIDRQWAAPGIGGRFQEEGE